MGDEKVEMKKSPTKDEANQLHSLDHPGVSLVNNPLVRSNYLAWSTSIMNSLEAKDKIGFIDGSIPPLEDITSKTLWDVLEERFRVSTPLSCMKYRGEPAQSNNMETPL
ncbi:Phosphoinositide phosphatase SAC1 [Senna tora]|uniref:Phosphoinositide phosphatase SAC1 n=1 Tax=Senna tora TaxID=362788 RepID=A0A834T0L4_9FABA|nr:Phosphoinositide phosphatase SAC1 [Senna tora]